MIELVFSLMLALLLDWRFKEVSAWHPLVGFGNYAAKLEAYFNRANRDLVDCKSTENKGTESKSSDSGDSLSCHSSHSTRRWPGILAWSLAVLPWVGLAMLLGDFAAQVTSLVNIMVGAIVLYFALGWQSLIVHAKAISEPLQAGDLAGARAAVAMIVSRDTAELDQTQVASAATESVLENGADAIFAAIFWFMLAGVPGVVLYRLSNTLDAMWGYRNARFQAFGWTAARVDDVLNFIPARLTALSYAVLGHYQLARVAWREQGTQWKSPNAGPVMAAGAGALNVRLGGGAIYHGQWQERDTLGPQSGEAASAASINSAISLVNRCLGLWLIVSVVLAMLLPG